MDADLEAVDQERAQLLLEAPAVPELELDPEVRELKRQVQAQRDKAAKAIDDERRAKQQVCWLADKKTKGIAFRSSLWLVGWLVGWLVS